VDIVGEQKTLWSAVLLVPEGNGGRRRLVLLGKVVPAEKLMQCV
jgi:hypothetical protein